MAAVPDDRAPRGSAWVLGCCPAAADAARWRCSPAYGALSALAFGVLMNLWFWPFITTDGSIAFVAGDPITENLGRLLAFTARHLVGLRHPAGRRERRPDRALGAPALRTLRRAHRVAAFGAVPTFTPPPSPATPVTA